MNYKIVASSVLVVAFFAFLIIAYVKYSSRNIENEKLEISQSVLNAIKNDPDLRQNSASRIDAGTLNKEQIEQIVKEMIANDPTVITNALDKIAATRAEQEKEAMKNKIKLSNDNIYNNRNDPQIGAASPKIKIVEFFDYFCGYCRRMYETNSAILAANPDVAFVFKELPILSEASIEASKFSLAVNTIDPVHYDAFQKALLSEHINSNDDIIAIAKKIGVDVDKLNTFMRDEKNLIKINAQIQDNMKIAADIGVRGTPTYIISDTNEVVAGASTVENMQQLIDKARQLQLGSNADGVEKSATEPLDKSNATTSTIPPALLPTAETQNIPKDSAPTTASTEAIPALQQNPVVDQSIEKSADPMPNLIEPTKPDSGINIPQPTTTNIELPPLPEAGSLPPPPPPSLPNPANYKNAPNNPTENLAPPPLPPISN